MKVSEFQKKFKYEVKLHNALDLPKYINNFNNAMDRAEAFDDIEPRDVCEAAYIEFITAAFEISLDVITEALVELKILSVD